MIDSNPCHERDAKAPSVEIVSRVIRRRAVFWAFTSVFAIAGVGLRAPALHANLFADDWDHYAIVKGIYPVDIPAWDMFRWVGNSSSEREALLHSGRLPWWTSSVLKLSVLRPLASLLAYLDYSLLDGVNHPALLHIHTLLWWVLLLLGVARLMQQLVPTPVALLATLMYAVDDCFIMPFAWVANRSEIIAVAFIVWALNIHIHGRRFGSKRSAFIVAVFVFLGLCAGEHAFAALPVFVSATLFESERFTRRISRLVPLAIISLIYISVRAAMGYGVAGSGFYIDPISEPLRYLRACGTRIPILMAELVLSIPCEWAYGAPFPRAVFSSLLGRELSATDLGVGSVGVGFIAGIVSLGAVAWLGRAHSDRSERALQWLIAGSLLGLVPLGGVIASGRLTLAPAIGFNALAAHVCWKSFGATLCASRWWTRPIFLLVALAVLYLAIVIPARRSYDGAHYMNGITNAERSRIERTDFEVESLTGRHVLVLSSRDLASEMSIPYIVHAAGRSMPETARLLSPRGDRPQVLKRIADKSFELTLAQPGSPRAFSGSVYRAEDDVMQAGDRIMSTDFEVTVLETNLGEPTRLRFDFNSSLDSSTLLFMFASDTQLMRLRMPATGDHVVIPPAPGP